MEELLFHPRTVHLPLGLAMVLPVLALGALLFARRFFRSTWVVIVALQAILAASAFVSLNAGEREEERVEAVVGEAPIETHEERAEAFAWSTLAVLLLGAAGLVPNRRTGRVLASMATVGTFVVLFLGVRTGESGGELVYRYGAAEAIRSDAPPREQIGQREAKSQELEED